MGNPFDEYDSEENQKAYDLTQQQRYNERMIREWTKRNNQLLKDSDGFLKRNYGREKIYSSQKQAKFKLDNQLFARKPEQFKTIRLPKKEYAMVMSEINTNITKEQFDSGLFQKAIGDYVYTVRVIDIGEYEIVGKEMI